MNNDGKNEDEVTGFWGGFKLGYEEEDAKIKKDLAPLERKIIEGAIEGVVETVVHPFRWLGSLLK